jgi:hypothetical protein
LVQDTKAGKNIPNDHKIHQTAIKYFIRPKTWPNGHKICQELPLQDPPKFTQIGLKTNHLATLIHSASESWSLTRDNLFLCALTSTNMEKDREKVSAWFRKSCRELLKWLSLSRKNDTPEIRTCILLCFFKICLHKQWKLSRLMSRDKIRNNPICCCVLLRPVF